MGSMARSRSWGLGILLATALLVPANAADLGTELTELGSAVSARLDAAPPKKEANKLAKAAKKLGGVTVATATPKDLFKILSAVFGSKTVDATVQSEAQDVLDCLRALAVAKKADAEAFLVQLDAKFADKLRAKLGGADKRFDAALQLTVDNPKKAAALFRAAFEKYLKSEAFATKALARQNAGPKLSNKIRMVATLSGDGSTTKFNEFAVRFHEFGQLQVFGCDAHGPDGVCRTSLGFNISYPADSRETGTTYVTFADYSESSDFGNGNGPGVQDRRWSGVVQVTVTESTGSRIKGTFRGQLTSDTGHTPQTLDVQGTWVVKR